MFLCIGESDSRYYRQSRGCVAMVIAMAKCNCGKIQFFHWRATDLPWHYLVFFFYTKYKFPLLPLLVVTIYLVVIFCQGLVVSK